MKMDSGYFDDLLRSSEQFRDLVLELDSDNVSNKKSILDVLSAACVFSKESYAKTLEALDHYKNVKKLRYRYIWVIEELRNANDVAYRTSILGLINCIIIYKKTDEDRIRIRNEFIGLKLLDVLHQIKNEKNPDHDLLVQVELFEENLANDEERLPKLVDLNIPLEVFHAVYKQVCETPLEVRFLAILRILLQIDSSDQLSDDIWEMIEKLISKVIVIEKAEDAHKLLIKTEKRLDAILEKDNKCFCSCHSKTDNYRKYNDNALRRRSSAIASNPTTPEGTNSLSPSIASSSLHSPIHSLAQTFGNISPSSANRGATSIGNSPNNTNNINNNNIISTSSSSSSTTTSLISPTTNNNKNTNASPTSSPLSIRTSSAKISTPPAPAPPPPAPPPPPPPPPFPGAGPPPPPPPPPPFPGCGPPPPPPPPPPFSSGGGFGGVPRPPNTLCLNMQQTPKLAQLNIPTPRIKLRTLQWQKIPTGKIVNQGFNLWLQLGKIFNGVKVDYETMDELFQLSQPSNPDAAKHGKDNTKSAEKKKKENIEINLLDSKRSLNVNIFLKQFKMPNDDIIQHLRNGASEKFGTEKLKALLKILPNVTESDMLKSFDGDRRKLGNAEKFFLQLMELPEYKIRIEGLLIREEFSSNMDWIKTSIDAIIETAKDIKRSRELQELLYMVLVAGNYLNAGNYAGNAAGFRVSSLLKITDIRANKPRMNLMHYVVMQAEKRNPRLLLFPHQMKFLSDAAQSSIESLTGDIQQLTGKVRAITLQTEKMDENFKMQMGEFLQYANQEMNELQEDLKYIDSLRTELADFFCEDVASFKLEECFNILQTFCSKFLKAIQENRQRKVLEEKAEARRRQLMGNKKMAQEAKISDIHEADDLSKQEGSIVDMLLADVRSGFANRKFGDSSFSITKIQKVQLDQHEMPKNITSESDTNLSNTNGDSTQSDDSRSEFIRRGYGRKSVRKSKRSSDSSLPDTESGVSTDTDTGVSSRTTLSETDYTDTDSVCSSQEDMPNFRRPRQRSSEDECLMEYLGQQIDETKNVDSFDKCASLRRRRHERRERRSHSDVDLMERERASSPCTMQDDTMTPVVMRREKSTLVNGRCKSETLPGANVAKESLRKSISALEKRDIDRARREVNELNEQERGRRTKSLHSSEIGNSGKLGSPYSSSPESRKYNDSFHPDDVRFERIGSLKRRSVHTSESSLQTIAEKDKQELLCVSSNSPKISVSNKNNTSNLNTNSVGNINNNNSNKLTNVNKILRSQPGNFQHEKVLTEKQDEGKYILDQPRINAGINSKEEQQIESHHVSVSVRSKISSNLGRNIDQILKQIEDSKIDIGHIKNRTNSASLDFPRRKSVEKDSIVAGLPKYHVELDKSLTRSSLSNSSPSMTSPCTSPSDKESKARREKRKVRRELCVDDVHVALKTCKDTPTDAYLSRNKNADFDQTESGVRTPRSRSGSDSVLDKEKGKTRKEDSSTKQAKLTGKRRFRAERFGDKENASSGRCRSNVEKESVDRALRNFISNGSMSRSKSYDESVARKYSEEFEMTKATNSGSEPDNFGSKSGFLHGSTGRLNGDSRRYGCYIPSDDSDCEPPMDNGRRSSKSSSRLSVKSTSTSTETLQAENCSDSESIPEYQQQSQQLQRTQETNRRDTCNIRCTVQEEITATKKGSSMPNDRKMRRAYSNLEPSSVESALARCEENARNCDELDPSPITIMAKWRLDRDRKRKTDHCDTHEQPKVQNKQIDPAKFDQGFFLNRQEGDFRNESGCRTSLASVSDKDEGFETMSETISQRTSVSSNLDLESGYCTPVMSRKSDILKFRNDIDLNRSVIEAENLRKSHGTSIITVHSGYSESDVRKQRTESWTESTVRVHVNTRKREAHLDSVLDCTSSSIDSGHDTSKDDMWPDHFDETHKLIIKDPKVKSANTNSALTVGSITSVTSPAALSPSSTTSPSETTSPATSSATSPKTTPKSPRVPGYMKRTSSSNIKNRLGGKDPTSNSYSTNKSSMLNRNSKLNRSVRVSPSSSASSLNRTKSGSVESVASSVSEKQNKVPNRRSVAGVPPTSASTTRSPGTKRTPATTRSPPTKTSGGGSSISRTQSLRSPNIRPMNVNSPRVVINDRRSTGSALTRNVPRSSSFMSPTTASKAKKDQKPTGALSPTNTNPTLSRLNSESSKSSSAGLSQTEKPSEKSMRSKVMSPTAPFRSKAMSPTPGSGSGSALSLSRQSNQRQSMRGSRDSTASSHQDYKTTPSVSGPSENASTSAKLRTTPRRTKSLGSTDNREASSGGGEKSSERKFERLSDRKSAERMSAAQTSGSSLVSDRKLNTVDEDDNGGFDVRDNRKNTGSNTNSGSVNNVIGNSVSGSWSGKAATKNDGSVTYLDNLKDKSLFKRMFPKSKDKISGRQAKVDIPEKAAKRKNVK